MFFHEVRVEFLRALGLGFQCDGCSLNLRSVVRRTLNSLFSFIVRPKHGLFEHLGSDFGIDYSAIDKNVFVK